MDGYILQPPQVCYLYVALQGLLQSSLREHVLANRIKETKDGFQFLFRDDETISVSQEELRRYETGMRRKDCRSALEQNPAWIRYFEAAYNSYLIAHPVNDPLATRQSAETPWGNIELRTISGYAHEVLTSFLGMKQVFWRAPSQKPRAVLDYSDDSSSDFDLWSMKGFLAEWKQRLQNTVGVLCFGTRSNIKDGEFLIHTHGYLVEEIFDDSLTLVDLRVGKQTKRNVSLSDLAPSVNHFSGGIL